MTNNILVGLTIGARLASNFRGAMSQTTSALAGLKRSGTELRAEHQRMGQALAKSISEPVPRVRELRAEYDRLGGALQRLEMRNKSLAGSMRATQALSNQRADLRGEMMGTAISGAVAAAPILASISIAAGFQEKMRDTRITGGMSAGEEAELSGVARESAKKFNQTQDEVANGIGVLVAGGISNVAQLKAYAPVMAKAATASKSSMDDVGATAIAMSNSLGISAKGFESAFTSLAYTGKRGQFETKDMAKWLPTLAPQMAALGITGKRAVAEIGASLQVARMGAGTNDEAANNFRNFLGKITSPDTLKDFEKAGIDLKGSLKNLVSQGMTPTQAMLEVIGNYMTKKGPEAAAEFKRVMSIKDDAERQAAMDRLNEAHKLGELFQDMQAMNFIRPAIQHAEELKDIQKGAMEAGDSGLLDADLKLRMETSAEQGKRFKIAMSEIALTLGNTLLPAVNGLIEGVMPMLKGFEKFAAANPGVIKGVLGVGAALFGGKLAVLGLRYAINLIKSPFAAFSEGKDHVLKGVAYFRALQAAGRFAPMEAGIVRVATRLGSLPALIGRARLAMTGMTAQGLAISALGKGQALMGGLKAALPWIGRAGMMLLRLTPIGLVLSTVGLLIYKFWQPLKGFFVGLWTGISAVAGPALKALYSGIGRLLGSVFRLVSAIPFLGVGFRLVGALIGPVLSVVGRALNGVWTWLKGLWGGFQALISPVKDVGGAAEGMGLRVGRAIGGIFATIYQWPMKFLSLGKNIVDGLVSGMNARVGDAIKSVGGFGTALAGSFAAKLGIKSPSRVFMGFGDNIAQGAALGIDKGRARAGAAAAGLALATTMAWAKPVLPAPSAQPLPALTQRVVQQLRQPDDAPPQDALDARVVKARDATSLALATTMAWAKPVLPAPSAQPLPALTQRVVQQLRRPDALPQDALAARVVKARDASAESPDGGAKSGRSKAAAQQAMNITYSPQITVATTAPQGVREQVTEALRLSQAEFERMLKRTEADRRRRSYETD